MKRRSVISFGLLLIILITSLSPVMAQVVDYVTEEEGVYYQYNLEDLIDSMLGEDNTLFERYMLGELKAVNDSENGYIDAEDVINAILESEEPLDIDLYTESETAKKIVLENITKLDKNGNEIVEDSTNPQDDFRVISIK